MFRQHRSTKVSLAKLASNPKKERVCTDCISNIDSKCIKVKELPQNVQCPSKNHESVEQLRIQEVIAKNNCFL